MSKVIKVNATLVTMAIPLTVKPGDQLMIVNNVCIGIYTGDSVVPIRPNIDIERATNAQALRVPAMERQVTGVYDTPSKKHTTGVRSGATRNTTIGIGHDGRPTYAIRSYIQEIAQLIREKGEVTAKQLYTQPDHMKDEMPKWEVKKAVSWLFHKGVIIPKGTTKNRSYAITTNPLPADVVKELGEWQHQSPSISSTSS